MFFLLYNRYAEKGGVAMSKKGGVILVIELIFSLIVVAFPGISFAQTIDVEKFNQKKS